MSGKTTAGRVIETYGGMRRFEGIETKEAQNMDTREKILAYGLTFQDTYLDRPLHDENWVLVRCRKNKKAFVWTYEYEGQLRINVKVDPQWRDFWRQAYKSVIPGYHQNKEHWNTVILDGTVPEAEVKRMIGESYDLCVKGKRSGECTRL